MYCVQLCTDLDLYFSLIFIKTSNGLDRYYCFCNSQLNPLTYKAMGTFVTYKSPSASDDMDEVREEQEDHERLPEHRCLMMGEHDLFKRYILRELLQLKEA